MRKLVESQLTRLKAMGGQRAAPVRVAQPATTDSGTNDAGAAKAGSAAHASRLDRLSAVVQGNAGSGERAVTAHRRAATQVDAALYELERLREEIGGVMRQRKKA